MADSILTTRQVADIFAVHPTTVMEWADRGILAHFKTPGGHRRYQRADVEALRDAQAVSTDGAVA
jgi:excisionase family DNA binding protein